MLAYKNADKSSYISFPLFLCNPLSCLSRISFCVFGVSTDANGLEESNTELSSGDSDAGLSLEGSDTVLSLEDSDLGLSF